MSPVTLVTESATESATLTPGEQSTLATTERTALVPVVVVGPDGVPVFRDVTLMVTAAAERKAQEAAAFARTSGMTAKAAVKSAAQLYKAMLADMYVEAGMESPVLRKASGRDSK